MSTPRQPPGSPAVPPLSVRTADGRSYRFSAPFQIGRDLACDVVIDDAQVSRKHLRVSFEDGWWRLHDQQSGNGVFVDDRRVSVAPVDKRVTVRLGTGGPLVVMEVERATAPPLPLRVPAQPAGETMFVAQRYFSDAPDQGPVGGRTLMIRKAFHNVQRKQKRIYRGIIALVVVAAASAGWYAYYSHQQMIRQQAIAEDLFYGMKSLDVEIATLEGQLAATATPQDRIQKYLEQRRQMRASYDEYVSRLNLYDHKLTAQEQLILRVTRLLGECEMAAPPDYLAEVANYIRRWQRSGRFAQSVNRAQKMGYVKKITSEFESQDLPPQFFYLALQESDFNEVASGPPTRMGIAKGMWQFIPDTAKRYGLAIGPLAAFPRPDVNDDRHNWEKATKAAASYIKDIYATDAQASGLLVMASYNWGEHRVIDMLRTMPANPRERNFWKVLERHREQVPKETYDYVLSIVSAAVIGENPRLFGFGFDNPLGAASQ